MKGGFHEIGSVRFGIVPERRFDGGPAKDGPTQVGAAEIRALDVAAVKRAIPEVRASKINVALPEVLEG